MRHGFTLIEIIVVIIIVGVLAAVGISQYSLMVEKGRTTEARVRLGTMRQLAYQYYLENKDMSNLQNSDVGVDNACHPTDFYLYYAYGGADYAHLVGRRCTSGGKTPNTTRPYYYFLDFYPATGVMNWQCYYIDDQSPCFGLPF